MGKFGIKGVQQEFWKLYYDPIKNGANNSLIEMQKNNDFSYIYVDLNFEYYPDGIVPEYEDHLIVVKAFQETMKELCYIRDPKSLLSILLSKDPCNKKYKLKQGVHLHFPKFVTDKASQERLFPIVK